MHEQEVCRIGFRADLLRNSRCHRYRGYSGGTDERVDLSARQLAHQLAEEHSGCCSEAERYQTENDDLDGSPLKECFRAGCCSDGGSQENDYYVHERVGSRLLKLAYDSALAEEVSEHQHSDKRCR